MGKVFSENFPNNGRICKLFEYRQSLCPERPRIRQFLSKIYTEKFLNNLWFLITFPFWLNWFIIHSNELLKGYVEGLVKFLVYCEEMN